MLIESWDGDIGFGVKKAKRRGGAMSRADDFDCHFAYTRVFLFNVDGAVFVFRVRSNIHTL